MSPVTGTPFIESVPSNRIIDAGKIEYVPARYTFVYENRDGEWLIAHHHSSLMSVS
jgi:hypothetical protein